MRISDCSSDVCSSDLRARIERLAEALADPDASLQAAEAIRSLVGQVVLTPGTERGQVHAALHGELGAILQLMAQKNKGLAPGPGVRLAAAAEKHARRGAYSGMECKNPTSSSETGFADHRVWSSEIGRAHV